MATTWGSIVGGYGRIGIDITTSNTNTQTTVYVKVYFWSKYSVTDSSNNYYYNNNATSATTNLGSKSIRHTVASGAGWSTSNRTTLASTSYTYSRGTSDKTYYCAAKLSGIDRVGGTMTVKASYKIPKKPSYTVSYNANGGSGAPGNQTKWYGTTLKLSTTKPTRTGYTFQGWGTSTTDTTVDYAPGANYTANASDTLYAIWKINTYTIKYDANGGSGAPGNQTKTYGTDLTISSIVPTKTNYTFKGWSTSATGSVAYLSGSSYTANAEVTLYAVWELAYEPPTITNFKVNRCTSSGVANEIGTYANVNFSWSCCQLTGANNVQSITVSWDTNSSANISSSGTSGNASAVIGSGLISTDLTYNITVTVTDSKGGSTSQTTVLPTTKFSIDIKAGGTGVAIGKVADTNDLFDVNLQTRFNKQITFEQNEMSGVTDANFPAILLNSSLAATDTFYRATRSDTGATIAFGVGSGGDNHGIWSGPSGSEGHWMINVDKNKDTHLNSDENLIISAPAQGINNRKFGENKVLWSGAWWPNENHRATLSEPVLAQPSGIVIIWSHYSNSNTDDYNFIPFFIPKYYVQAHGGKGVFMSDVYCGMRKYVYVSNTVVVGNTTNDESGTDHGHDYDNKYYVMRYIIGV